MTIMTISIVMDTPGLVLCSILDSHHTFKPLFQVFVIQFDVNQTQDWIAGNGRVLTQRPVNRGQNRADHGIAAPGVGVSDP